MTHNDPNNNPLDEQADFVLEAISVNSPDASSTANRTSTIERNSPKHAFYRQLRSHLWFFPLSVSLLLPSFTIGAYIYAVCSKQMKPILPFISDAIGVAPQAGLANEMFDLVNILVLVTGYIRYKQTKYYLNYKTASPVLSEAKCPPLRPEQISRLHSRNFVSMLCLLGAVFGMFIIANCRVPENPNLHFCGVILLVHGISAYFLIILLLTKKLHAVYGIESKPQTMTIVCVASVVLLYSMLALTFASMYVAGREMFLDNQWRFNWSPDQPGYDLHVLSTAVEWIGIVLCGSILYLCLFRRIKNFADWHKVQF